MRSKKKNNAPECTPVLTERSVASFLWRRLRPTHFVRLTFGYLREHRELLRDPDYQRLYDELLDFQIRNSIECSEWTWEEKDLLRYTIEVLTDLQNRDRDEQSKLSADEVAEFLEFRRKEWYGR